jgi:hypothetical protein
LAVIGTVICSAFFYYQNATDEGYMLVLLDNTSTISYDSTPRISAEIDSSGEKV